MRYFNEIQWEKHSFPINVKWVENCIDGSELQFAKHSSPIYVIVDGKVIDDNREHPWKQERSNLYIDDGISILSNEQQ